MPIQPAENRDDLAEPRQSAWRLLRDRWFWGIFCLALVLRLAAGFWWQGRLNDEERFFYGDSLSYEVLARQIAQGKDYAYGTAYVARTPGYPLLLSPFYLADEHPPVIWLRGVSVLLGMVALTGVGLIATWLFSPLAGRWASFLVAVYPGALGLSVFVLSEGPFCGLMLAYLTAAALAWRSERWQGQVFWGFVAGAVFGVTVLFRPSWLLFPGFALVLGLMMHTHRRRQLLLFGLTLVGGSLVMMPWWVRNYRVVGEFVPTTLQVGPSLYDGISPTATGASDMRFVAPWEQRLREEDAAAEQPPIKTFESRFNRRLRDEAVAWAVENPARVVELAWVKLLRYWSPFPNDENLGGGLVRWGIAAGFLPLVILGLGGAIRYSRRGLEYALLWYPLLYFGLLHMIFVSSIRYRQPAMLALAVLAGAILAEVVSRWWPDRTKVKQPS
ncbi:MAG: hypothetical protein WD045_09630 [Pirellulaceae bacterium]